MRMSASANLYRLLTWMSPSYPVGAYSFSHGLENAIAAGRIESGADTRHWIADLLCCGNGQADLVFLAAAWDAAGNERQLATVQELALAFQPTSEIRRETTAQGEAFLRTSAAAWPCDAIDALKRVACGTVTYPVAVGAIARGHAVRKDAIMAAWGHAFAANLVSAAVRLVPLGQTDGQRITAALEDDVDKAVGKALATPLDRVASSTVMADITSMQHEVQYTRLFQS